MTTNASPFRDVAELTQHHDRHPSAAVLAGLVVELVEELTTYAEHTHADTHADDDEPGDSEHHPTERLGQNAGGGGAW